jgi:hypothetical protein
VLDAALSHEDHSSLSMNSCLSGRDVWLLDCMNIRGACNFPELSLFCEAIRRWAASLETARRLPPLVVLAIDHGLRQEAFALSATLAVAFSGDADADTLIVSAVDALLSADPHELRVVTSDHLLRQRCRRELPLDASEAYLGGVQRPLEQLVTLAFESSETFARTLTLTPAAVPSADSVFSAYGGEAPEAPEGGSGAAVEAPMPLTKRARRKAQRRAETQCARARCYSETTAERVRAAESLHRRVAERHARFWSSGSASTGASRALREGVEMGVAAAWMRWYHAAAVPLRHLKQPDRDANSPAWWAVPPGPAREADDAHDDAPDDAPRRARVGSPDSAFWSAMSSAWSRGSGSPSWSPRFAFGKAAGLGWRNCMTGFGAVAAAALGVLCVAAAVSLPMLTYP